MKLGKTTAEIFVPDGRNNVEALKRTTHMALASHQDDIEIMALDGVLQCFGNPDKWFTGVITTNGAGSARDNIYAGYTDEQMQAVRRQEQKKAAFVGEYGAAVFLDYASSEIKDSAGSDPVNDIRGLLEEAAPEIVYTHNPADKHPTHVATALRVIQAARLLPRERRPLKLYGCEVWRDLDWMSDKDKTVFNLDGHENIAASLLGVYDSQIIGGKRYDLASMGRRRAHATYHESHAVDVSSMINFAMDLTPLIADDRLDIGLYVKGYLDRFAAEVMSALDTLLQPCKPACRE